MNDNQQNRYQEYRERFSKMSDEELIADFNGDVGHNGWTSSRASRVSALRYEFENRGFDYSDIGDKDQLSLKNKVKLIGKKVVVL